jgi:hypothetical protein
VTVTISGLGRRFQLAGVCLVLVALAIAMFARPASAAVTGSATPSTGLALTGTLSITASGFATNLNVIQVLECVHGATDSIQCDANTVDPFVSADTSGDYSNSEYHYTALPNSDLGVSNIVCDKDNPCDLLVIQDDYNNFSNPHILIPISFSVSAETTTSPSTTLGTIGTTTTTAPAGATTTIAGATTVPTGDSTTTPAGGSTTTAVGGSTTTAVGAGTTFGGQGSTLPAGDPGGVDNSGSGSGGTLPFTGPPTAAPIVAVCGLVILFAGTFMRRVVLRVPNSGVSLS